MANCLKKPVVRNWEDLPLILTADETALLLKCNINTVLKFCRSGSLKAVKTDAGWRVAKDTLMDYYNNGGVI